MLGLILLYFIGKSFYTLAEENNRSRWGFTILGIAIYYIGSFLGGLILGLLTYVFGYYIDFENELLLGFLAFPFGLLAWWVLYTLLKKNWEKNPNTKNSEILDDVFIDE